MYPRWLSINFVENWLACVLILWISLTGPSHKFLIPLTELEYIKQSLCNHRARQNAS